MNKILHRIANGKETLKLRATGNVAANRRRGRRSAMATAPTEPLSTPSAAVSASTSTAEPFDFSIDSTMPRLRLSADQLRYCSEALEYFKAKKFNSPQTIHQEFQTLQVCQIIPAHVLAFDCRDVLILFVYERDFY